MLRLKDVGTSAGEVPSNVITSDESPKLVPFNDLDQRHIATTQQAPPRLAGTPDVTSWQHMSDRQMQVSLEPADIPHIQAGYVSNLDEPMCRRDSEFESLLILQAFDPTSSVGANYELAESELRKSGRAR